MFSVSRVYSLRMLCVPEDSVTVTAVFVTSRITVSLVAGRRAVGSVVLAGVSCPGSTTGKTGAWPLFQFESVAHWPLVLVTHNAGMSRSFMNSGPPWATSTSQLLPPLPFALTRPVLPGMRGVWRIVPGAIYGRVGVFGIPVLNIYGRDVGLVLPASAPKRRDS